MIIENTKKLLSILTSKEKAGAIFVCGVTAIIAMIEVLGVASIMPFIAILASPEVIHSNKYLSFIYEGMSFDSDRSFLIAFGAFVFFFLIGSLLLKAAGFWLQIRYTGYRLYSISSRLIESYMRQPYQWFLKSHSANLATSILNEVSQVVNGSLFPTLMIVSHSCVAVLLLVLLTVADPILAMAIFTFLGGSYAAIFLSTRNILERRGASARNANRFRFKVVQEGFGGIKDVKVMGIEGKYVQDYKRLTLRMTKDNIVSKVISDLPSFILQGLIFGGMMLVMLYLLDSRGDLRNAAPIFALYALGGYKLMPALQNIYAQLGQIKFSNKSLDMLVKDVEMASKTVRDERASLYEDVKFNDAIRFEDVDFGYDNKKPEKLAIKGICFTIDKNTTVGFVGRSGSGKTTTADLILGLLDPTSGKIMIDDMDIADLKREQLASLLGYVPQSIFLTDNSVSANIAMGGDTESVDMEAVIAAAKIADLHDFIMTELPDGYETFVGERGVRLSGGQRQRMGIARALYHDPDILVMDEATSALDNITERAVMDAVAKLKSEKTIILIAHRLSTIEGCDKVVLFDNGCVVEEGPFEQLKRNSIRFKELSLQHEESDSKQA